MEITRGYRVKIYPSKAQEAVLLRQMGACRYVYNHFLALKKDTYLQTGENLTYNTMCRELTKLRKEIVWFSEVQYQPLAQSLRCLDLAFNRFFRKQAKFPVFHKKGQNDSMRKFSGWDVYGNKISIMRGFLVRFRGTFPEQRQGTITITHDATGSWWASTIAKEERKPPKLKKEILGIDVGIETLATTSTGKKYENIRPLDSFAKKLRATHQALSRTKKGSKRRAKARLALSRLHRKVGFIRSNHIHHVTKAIVSKNHATIAVEDLSVTNMMKNRHLSRTIGDTGWGELYRQLRYKQEWNGGEVVEIGRFFPSSKTCSSCHFVADSMPLSKRYWTCPRCSAEHDRDINAAKVIAQQAGERLGAEGGDGSGSLRRSVRVARPLKRGYAREKSLV